MRSAVILLLLLISFSRAHSQGGPKILIWSEDARCEPSEELAKQGGRIRCSSVKTNRGRVVGIEHNGLKIAVLPQSDSDYFVVGVALSNSTSEHWMFDSDLWSVAHFRSLSEFAEGGEPLYRGRSIPTRMIIRGLRISAAQGNSLDTYLASNQTSPKTVEFRRPDGSTGRTVVRVPNEDEQNRARERSGIRNKLAEERQEQIRKFALTAKTIAPMSNVTGMVYFQKKNDAGLSILTMPVGDVTYVIGIGNKAK